MIEKHAIVERNVRNVMGLFTRVKKKSKTKTKVRMLILYALQLFFLTSLLAGGGAAEGNVGNTGSGARLRGGGVGKQIAGFPDAQSNPMISVPNPMISVPKKEKIFSGQEVQSQLKSQFGTITKYGQSQLKSQLKSLDLNL